MRVLVVGTGGREAAIGWKLKQDPKVKKYSLQEEMLQPKNMVRIYMKILSQNW